MLTKPTKDLLTNHQICLWMTVSQGVWIVHCVALWSLKKNIKNIIMHDIG